MNPLVNIKHHLLNHSFKRNLLRLTRERKTFNLKNAQTLGLVFFIENDVFYQKALEIIKIFQEKNIKVQALGFINQKNYPSYLHPRIFFDIFTLKDLNWFGKPKVSSIENFVKMDYDILIDMSNGKHFVLKYISGLSAAKFKVGRYAEKNEAYYDLMINMDMNMGFEEYVHQVIHYLNLINN